MRILLSAIILVLFLNACVFDFHQSGKSALPGTWRLYDATPLHETAVTDDSTFLAIANLKKLVKQGAAFSFFEDGSFTDFEGVNAYAFGNYKFSNQDSLLTLTEAGKSPVTIKAKLDKNIAGKQEFTFFYTTKNVQLKFIKESEPVKNFKDDPFYPDNNDWRIKPQQSETAAQLTKRLAGYVKQLSLILKASKERKQDIVSFEFSMGPIKIYNGGIGIHPYNIVPGSWKNTFYDEADALKAYEQYDNYLSTNSYKGASTGNWIDDDNTILLSIYADLSQTK